MNDADTDAAGTPAGARALADDAIAGGAGSGAGPLSPLERRAAASLALIYVARMLGLFIVLPVFSLHAEGYAHATPLLIGVAIGIYGLLQALLQVPFGMLSDRVGRKRVVALGLVLLAVGSVVAAVADDIRLVILGRALQGAGAIAAALMALAADLTRDEQRTKVMAVLGASIALSFVLALVLGPVLIARFGSLDALFWLTAGCALLSLALLFTAVPEPQRCRYSAETGANLPTMRRLLAHPMLLRLDASIFLLHLTIIATFFAVPLALADAGIATDSQWWIYLVAVVLSLAIMVPLIVLAERRAMRGALVVAVLGLGAAQLPLALAAGGFAPLGLGLALATLALFFGFLNALEALLPALVSRLAPAAAKGSAMGVYSSSQFLGAFVGGVGAGWLYARFGALGLHLALAALALVWTALLAGFVAPAPVTTRRLPLAPEALADPDRTLAELRAGPGVREVALAVDEGVAYIKVDRRRSATPGRAAATDGGTTVAGRAPEAAGSPEEGRGSAPVVR